MQKSTIFPHQPMGTSVAFKKSDIVIDGMKVKFDKVAMLVPTELTLKDGKAVSMSFQRSRAFDTMVFDPAKCIELEYTSPGMESLGQVVARNFTGLGAEEMSKAIEFHVMELRKRNILNSEQLLEGQVIPVWIYKGDMQEVEVIATRAAVPAEVETLALAMMEAFHEGHREALGRLKNILWWPEKESMDENAFASGFIWGVFKLVIAMSKDLMPKPYKYITEFSVGAIETVFKKYVFSKKNSRVPSKSQQTFDWVQDYEFYLGHISKNKEEMAKEFAREWGAYRNTLATTKPEKLSEYDAYSRKLLQDSKVKFKDNFSIELMILARFFQAVHPEAKMVIRYKKDEKVPHYKGLANVPEDKVWLLNAEYNRLANALQWHYMEFYKIGLDVEVTVGDFYTRPALIPSMSWTGTGFFKSDKWNLAGHLSDHREYPDIPKEVYYYDYPLNMPGYAEDPWKVVTQSPFRIPFPVRFSEK